MKLWKSNERVYAAIIPNVQKDTVMPIIGAGGELRSRYLYRRMEKVYGTLAVYGYNHKTVKYEENEFMNEDTHVNGIESYWSWIKQESKKKFNRVRKREFELFLLEREWWFYHSDTIQKDMKKLIRMFMKSKDL